MPSVKQSRVERQRWIRIRIAIAAYAYEVENNSIMSDADFDKLCQQVDPMISTGNAEMDAFFEDRFDPSTGLWIFQHPQIEGIKRLYREHHQPKPKPRRPVDDLA